MGRLTLAVLLLHIVCGILQVRGQAANCVIRSADVGFVIDASGSVDTAEWKQALTFASNLVNGYDIGTNKVRVGLIVFSNTAKMVFDFNRFNTAAQINSAIAGAPKESQSTYTHVALDLARNQLFQPKSGMRPNVPNIMIVITDGQSTVKASTLASAKAAHQAGINVVAVGVKGAALDELKGIASKPSFVYTFQDFAKLIAFQNTFRQEICKAAVKLAPTTPPPTTEKPCIVKSADIAFIVDASGSVGSTEWTQSLVFAKNIVNGYDIGPTKVKVAMMQFSSTPQLLFDFNRYPTKAALVSAITGAKKNGGGTATSLALDLARTTLFKTNKGMRPGVPNLVFVITDGKSNNAAQTKTSAAALHKLGVTVFAIGVKGANINELKTIASAPNLVYNYQDYNKLASIQAKFNQEACKVAVKLTAPPPSVGCSVYNADIVFVVDTSSSVGDDNFKLTKTFLSNMMEKMDFGKIRVGVIQFNDKPKTVFELNQNNGLAQAQASINKMVYDKGPSTRISSALSYMRNHSFTAANGDRAGAPNLGIIITDGQSKDPYRTQYVGNLIKKEGVELFAVGVGADIDKAELQSLASSKNFVYTVKDFKSLYSIRDTLASKLCQGFTLPPTTTPAPCLCKDKEKNCYEYGAKICHQPVYRAFATDKCPVFCDLCKPGCRKVIPPPRKCEDTVKDCDVRVNVCTDARYKQFALASCAKFCKLCNQINPTRYIQTTPKATRPPVTKAAGPPKPPVPPKPTVFTPCDPNCYDKERDCTSYDIAACKRKDFEAFFKSNCAKYCSFCTPIAKCRPAAGTCADKMDCSGYDDTACVDYPQWARTTCKKRCGHCPGGTPILVKPTPSTVCEDKEDCASFGDDVCTDYPDYSKINCPLFCKICVPKGGYTTEKCADKIDCSIYLKTHCTNPDYRKFMLAKCRVFCGLCGVEN